MLLYLAERMRPICAVLRWVGLCIHFLWLRRHATRTTIVLTQVLEALLDVGVVGIEIRGPLIGVDSIADLVVARLVQRAEVVPDLTDVWVDADGLAVGVQRVSVLVDLEIGRASCRERVL